MPGRRSDRSSVTARSAGAELGLLIFVRLSDRPGPEASSWGDALLARMLPWHPAERLPNRRAPGSAAAEGILSVCSVLRRLRDAPRACSFGLAQRRPEGQAIDRGFSDGASAPSTPPMRTKTRRTGTGMLLGHGPPRSHLYNRDVIVLCRDTLRVDRSGSTAGGAPGAALTSARQQMVTRRSDARGGGRWSDSAQARGERRVVAPIGPTCRCG